MSKSKQTKEEKEAEFISAIELILGFPLKSWHKEQILIVRQASLAGKPIQLTAITHPRKWT